MTIIKSITRDETEIDVTVELKYHRGSRGHCDRYGAQEEPDTEEFEIVSVTPDIELTDNEIELITELAFNKRNDELTDQDESVYLDEIDPVEDWMADYRDAMDSEA